MARLPRLALAGHLHALQLRAIDPAGAFRDETDRAAWRDALAHAARSAGVAVHGYSLLTAEVRLLVTPARAEGPGELMQSVGRRFAHHVRSRHGRAGTLWDGRFRSTIVEPAPQFAQALAWAEGVDTGLAAAERGHGSLGHHLGRWSDPLVTEHAGYWQLGNTPFEREAAYRALVESPPVEALARLAQAVRSGWVFGSDRFLQAVAAEAGRRTQPLPKGRPVGTTTKRLRTGTAPKD